MTNKKDPWLIMREQGQARAKKNNTCYHEPMAMGTADMKICSECSKHISFSGRHWNNKQVYCCNCFIKNNYHLI